MSYMEMEPLDKVSPGRTYKYYTGPVVYPFGYGMSLTTFKVRAPSNPTSTLRRSSFHNPTFLPLLVLVSEPPPHPIHHILTVCSRD